MTCESAFRYKANKNSLSLNLCIHSRLHCSGPEKIATAGSSSAGAQLQPCGCGNCPHHRRFLRAGDGSAPDWHYQRPFANRTEPLMPFYQIIFGTMETEKGAAADESPSAAAARFMVFPLIVLPDIFPDIPSALRR